MPEVFISHSSKDQIAAHAAVTALESHGIPCWVAPRNISPGKEWGEAIVEGIEACSVFVLLFSGNANESPQVRREVERAVSKRLIILPVRLEDIMPQKSLEYFLSAAHWLDAFPQPFEDYLESLVEVIQRLSDKAGTPATASAPRIFSNTRKAKFPNATRMITLCLLLFGGGLALKLFPWPKPTDEKQSPPPVPVPNSSQPNPSVQEEKPVSKPRPIPTDGFEMWSMNTVEDEAIKRTVEKMRSLRFPSVPFMGATIEEAIEFLRMKSRDLDADTTDPAQKGVNIILMSSDTSPSASITLDLKDVPMEEALRYVTELAGMKYKVEPHAVLVVPISESTAAQTIRVYPFNDELLEEAKDEFRSSPIQNTRQPADPFAPEQPPGIQIFTAKNWLLSNGVPFPDGASAVNNPQTQTLIVRNTAANHELIGELISVMYRRFKNLERPLMNAETLGKDWDKK